MSLRRAAPLFYAGAVLAAGLLRRLLLPAETDRLFPDQPELAALFLAINALSVAMCLYVRRYPAYRDRAEKPLFIALALLITLLATATPTSAPAIILCALAAGLAGLAAHRINRPQPPPPE